jgi:hypothetical protein
MGEKLSFLSCLNGEPRTKRATKLVVDFNLRRLNEKLKIKGSITIDRLPKTSEGETPETFCLKIVQEKVMRFNNTNTDSGRLVVVIDPSSLPFDRGESLDDGALAFEKQVAFHKNIMDTINSAKGVTAVLLYDANVLREKLMTNLIKLHQPIGSSISGLTPKKLHEESAKRINVGKCYREIMVSQHEVMLLDPASESGALLLPITKAIEEVLPNDPLNVTHRDVAFTNNYTSHAFACPYWSSEVESGCLLDPSIVPAIDTQGRSFIEGRPCVTAVDYMIFDEKQDKSVDCCNNSKPDEADRNGTVEYADGSSETPTTSNDPISLKHPVGNQRLKSAFSCKTTKLFP